MNNLPKVTEEVHTHGTLYSNIMVHDYHSNCSFLDIFSKCKKGKLKNKFAINKVSPN